MFLLSHLRFIFLILSVPLFIGCSKFQSAITSSGALKSEESLLCEPGTVAIESVSVPNGKCMVSCKADGSAYECSSQAFIVCNPGYALASNQTLGCVSSVGSTSGGTTGGSTTGSTTSGGNTTGGTTSGGSTTGGTTSGGSTTGGTTTGGLFSGGSATGGTTSGGSTTSGTTSGGSTTSGTTSGGTTAGGSTTGGTTSGGSTGGGTTTPIVSFYVDAKAYNPESTVAWIQLPQSTVINLYLGKIRLNEEKVPQIKIRILGNAGTLESCTNNTMEGVNISAPVRISAQELHITLQLQSGRLRILNSDFSLCGRVSSSSTNTNIALKLKGEVQ